MLYGFILFLIQRLALVLYMASDFTASVVSSQWKLLKKKTPKPRKANTSERAMPYSMHILQGLGKGNCPYSVMKQHTDDRNITKTNPQFPTTGYKGPSLEGAEEVRSVSPDKELAD